MRRLVDHAAVNLRLLFRSSCSAAVVLLSAVALLTHLALIIAMPFLPGGLSILIGGLMAVAAGIGRGQGLLRSALEPAGRRPISNGRIELRPMGRREAAEVASTVDATMMSANGWNATYRDATVAGWHSFSNAHRLGNYAIREPGDSTIHGIISVQHHNVPAPPLQPVIGLWLGPTGRGRGLAMPALAALLALARSNGLRRVYLGTAVTNDRMRQVAERVGGTVVQQKRHHLPDGSTTDSVWYEFRLSQREPAQPPANT